MHFQIHADIARQTQEQISRRTRATRPTPADTRGRRTRTRPRRLPFAG